MISAVTAILTTTSIISTTMNKNYKRASILAALSIAFSLSTHSAYAATITVGPLNDITQYDYQTIQDAVDAASGQDLVFVTEGEYTENIRIPANSQIRIRGNDDDPEKVVIHGNIQFQTSNSLTQAVLRSMTIRATGLNYAVQSSQSISLMNMRIVGGRDGVVMKDGNIDITTTTIRRAERYGLLLSKDAESLWMYTSIVKKNKKAGIRIEGDFYGRITDSQLLGNGRGITLEDAHLLNTGNDYGLVYSELRHNKTAILLIRSSLQRTGNSFEQNDKRTKIVE